MKTAIGLLLFILPGVFFISGTLGPYITAQSHEWTEIESIESGSKTEQVLTILQDLKYPVLGIDDSLLAGKWSTQSKVTLLWYFASWCWNCNQEIPILNKVYKQYKPSGFDIIGIGVYSPLSDLLDFREKYDIQFPIVVGPVKAKAIDSRKHTLHYELRKLVDDERTWGMPFHIFIVSNNEMSVFTASGEIREQDIRRFVETHLD